MSSEASESGFTLIELVVVIVIIGILAAAALPRFVDLTGDARQSAAQGLAGSLSGGAALVHGKWLAEGESTATGIEVKGDVTVQTSSSGYPEGDETALKKVLSQNPANSGNWTWEGNDGLAENTSGTTWVSGGDPSWKITYNPKNGVARAVSE